MKHLDWHCRDRDIRFERPLILGIVNVTPDSFSDGGRYYDPKSAVDHALKLVAEGADLLDIGGESTRPGSQSVSQEEELRRVVPVVKELVRQTSVPISIDTSKSPVAEAALDAGAHIINDVTALGTDPQMPGVCAKYQAGVILMHMQGTPATMQIQPTYRDVVSEVNDYFRLRTRMLLLEQGLTSESLCLDPGIGFGKTTQHNLQLLANLDELAALGWPVCLGVSRKGFIGKICERTMPDLVTGSISTIAYPLALRSAHLLRVHDVAATRDMIRMTDAIMQHRRGVSPD